MPRLTLADLGAGYGVGAQLLHDVRTSRLAGMEHVEFARYIAVDVSAERLGAAVGRARARGIDAEGYLFDLDSRLGTSPPAGQADIAVVAFVLVHLADPRHGLAEAARVTKDSGVVLVVDAAYRTMVAEGDPALVRSADAIRERLRHGDFSDLDSMARQVGLRRLSGLDDATQRFGAGELSPKRDALGFIALFDPNDPARTAWEQIDGGTLHLTYVRRAYVKDGSNAARVDLPTRTDRRSTLERSD